MRLAVSATLINYTFSGVSADLNGDEETIAGFFTFDLELNPILDNVSDVSITLSGPSPYAGIYTSIANVGDYNNAAIDFTTDTVVGYNSDLTVSVDIGIPLLGSGGSPLPVAGLEVAGDVPTAQDSAMGDVVYSSVPEPGTLSLLAVAFGALWMVGRKRSGNSVHSP